MRLIALTALVFVLSAWVYPISNPSLVAYYPMDKQTGNVCLDIKNGDRLLGYGNPYIQNAAGYCNGSTSHYEATNQAAFKNITNRMSISFWGKRVATNSPCFVGTVDVGASLAIWNAQNTVAGNFQFAILSPPTTINVFGTGGAQFQSANVWRHFVATYDGSVGVASSRVKLYVNGVNISSLAAMTGTIPATLHNPSNSTLRIGRGIGYAGNSFIKFVALYDRPLTANEVANIYKMEYNQINKSPK